MKRLTIVCIVVMMVIGLLATAPALGAKKLHFVFVTPLVANPYWDVVERGVKDAAKELGVQADYVGPTKLDLNEMLDFVETAIAQKVDGIGSMALNADAFAPVVAEAKKRGIPFVFVDTDAPKSQRDAYMGTDNVTAGKALGEAVAKFKKGKAKIGLMTGALDQPNLNQRIDGFKQAISKYPGMKIVVLESDMSDLQLCIQKAEAMLQAYPEIDTLVGVEGFGAPGLGRVVKEAGKVGKITVFGFDDLPDTVDFIKEGVVQGTVVQRQYMMGYLAIKNLYKLANGEKIPEITDTGVIVVTKENVDTYKK